MRIRVIAISILIILSGVSNSYSQETRPEINRAERLKQLAAGKAGGLQRQWDKKSLQDPMIRAELDKYDVTYYDIHWRPDFSDSSLYGEVGIYARSTVESLNSVMLLLDNNLVVDSVYDSYGTRPYSHHAGLLTIYLDKPYNAGEEFGFTVAYDGQPQADYGIGEGLFFVSHQGVPIVENLSEPYGARKWWPCKDIPSDKADSIDVRVTADTGMVPTSNGVLVSDIDHGDGTHTVHWKSRYPITTYLVCLAVTNYMSWTDYYVYSPTDSMPIVNYVFPEVFDHEDIAYDVTPQAIAIFADMFGEYPFIEEKYGHSLCIIHGMEHQHNTFLNMYFSVDEATVVHELAHHWWGNLVTCSSWHHIWLNEGFATYCEPLYYEVLNGTDYYHAYMNDIEYLEGGSLYVTDVSNVYEIFSWRSYCKGAWVLHMLRHIVGDSAFFNGMKQYAIDYAHGNASTEDFQGEIETASGMELDWFFQDWIYGTYYPNYRYSYMIEQDPSGGWIIYLHVRQRQTSDPTVFRMMIDMLITTAGGEETEVVFNDSRRQNYIIHMDEQPVGIYFDPDRWILRYVLWESYTLHIANESLASAALAEYYEDTILVKGGSGDYICEVISGALPDGWQLDQTSGIITGICLETGAYPFTVRATDLQYSSYVDSMEFIAEIGPPGARPGDANADGGVDVADAVYVINFIFKGGSAPPVPNWADVNVDCQVNVADAVYLINYIFKEGAEPQHGCVQ